MTVNIMNMPHEQNMLQLWLGAGRDIDFDWDGHEVTFPGKKIVRDSDPWRP